MADTLETLIARYLLSSSEFERSLRAVRPEQWSSPTPCAEWDVRQLVNHVTRGNFNYVLLLDGGSRADFLRLRDVDALGADPAGAYARSVRGLSAAFGSPGALERSLDYPLGQVNGRQALAIRLTDNTIHAWDLARAVGADDTLDPGLVAWIDGHLDEIYAGLAGMERFFATADGTPGRHASRQDRLLHSMGRNPLQR
jgi:uncharacterized protein (TIGR03086 family)